MTKKSHGCMSTLIAGLLVLGVFCGGPLYFLNWLANRPPAPPKTPEEIAAAAERREESDRKTAARGFAEDAVLASLKYPDNANIYWASHVRKAGENTYVVNGKVDAMNTFGAKITHSWFVTISVDENTYTVEKVIIEE